MNSSMDASSQKRLRSRVWDAVVDANPVVAKELLVTARTPMFVGSVVAAPLLLSALVLLVRSTIDYEFDGEGGRRLFTVYFAGLSIALGLFGAALGSTVVVQEREAGMLDALRFSALGVRRIVVGKFAAVLLAEGALVVATLPLLAFVYAKGRTSLAETAVALAIAAACGVMAASIGIGVSANERNTRRSLLVSLFGAGVVGIGVIAWLVTTSEDLGRYDFPFGVARGYLESSLEAKYFAELLVVPAFSLTGVLWLGHAASTSGLMDPSDDRGRPIKRWMLGIYAIGAVCAVICAVMAGVYQRGEIVGCSMVAAALLAFVLLFVFVGEPLRPTRRMQAERATALARGVYAPGLVPSIFFTILVCGFVLVFLPVLGGVSDVLELKAFWLIAFLAVLGGLMGAAAAYRGAPFARRMGAVSVAVFTLLFVLGRGHSPGPAWADLLCPLGLNPDRQLGAQTMFACSLIAWIAAGFMSLALLVRAGRAKIGRAEGLRAALP